jgi:hypothetical protein
MRALRIHFYPTTLLLDPDGKVVSLDEKKKGQLDLRGKELLDSLQSVFFPVAKNKPAPRTEANVNAAAASDERPTLRRNNASATSGATSNTTTMGNVRLPAPPDGFQWKAATNAKLYFVVPEDWKYTEEVNGDEVVITISEDDAAAVDVVATVRKKVTGNAVEVAKATMDKFTKGKQLVGNQQNQAGDQMQMLSVIQEGNQVTFYLIVANTKTNSLRVGTFSCPLGRMDAVGQKAQIVLTQVLWVE